MKKITIAVLIFLCAASLFALDGTAVSITGKVEIQKNGGEWVLLKEGDSVPPGAVISTGFKASAGIQLGGSLLTVNQLTRITLRELTESSDKVTTDIYLDAGSLRADVKPLNNKANGFQVQTSVVTSSVRGTVLNQSAMGDIYMTEHNVQITTPTGQFLTISEGESGFISEGMAFTSFGVGNAMQNYPTLDKTNLSGGGDSADDGEKTFSAFSKGNVGSGVSVESSIVPPSDKNFSPLEIVAGDLSGETIHLPAVGFSDMSETAEYEESLYSSVLSLSFD